VITEYLAEKLKPSEAQPPPPAVDPNTLTMKKFIEDNVEKGANLQFSVALVAQDASYDQAKAAMNAMTQSGWCQDVMVTKTGSKNEKVIGWITNRMIEDKSKV